MARVTAGGLAEVSVVLGAEVLAWAGAIGAPGIGDKGLLGQFFYFQLIIVLLRISFRGLR
jgi:hypothetical protein